MSPLATQLSWTHCQEVLPIDEIQRECYLTRTAEEIWSIRVSRFLHMLITIFAAGALSLENYL